EIRPRPLRHRLERSHIGVAVRAPDERFGGGLGPGRARLVPRRRKPRPRPQRAPLHRTWRLDIPDGGGPCRVYHSGVQAPPTGRASLVYPVRRTDAGGIAETRDRLATAAGIRLSRARRIARFPKRPLRQFDDYLPSDRLARAGGPAAPHDGRRDRLYSRPAGRPQPPRPGRSLAERRDRRLGLRALLGGALHPSRQRAPGSRNGRNRPL
ncbi:MAG: hypothetical protein AVDCRST_MAG91-2810, partial [uncultured Sphingomonadaceae bacterium]